MRLLLTTFLALVSLALFSQSPEKINYQSIVRDLAGNVIQNQPISLRMSILSDSINGTIVYQETFQPTTNNFGLVNIKIGEGTPVIATMSSVDWSNGPFFLESAVDVTGGTNYIVVSTSQFMSVPYALYASESPLDTTQVQNIVNQQTNNFLDSSSIQNMIDSSVLNIDSTLIASWGYIDSNSIMILINNNSLDSTTIQNMIDNSIVNIDSSTVASWGYLDSSTIQILINNSTIDSSSVSNWGYLDSTTIQNIITQQTNIYLDSTSVQNMIDNSVTNIDSSTVASWGYIDSSSIMILINNNSLDSAAIQNMINSSITNVDSSTVASWGYLDSSSIIALISNSNIDSSSVANWGYLDSVSIQNMINNSSVNVDSAMIANFGFVAGPHTIDTDTQIDSTGIANYGFVTSSQVLDSVSIQNMINNSSSNVDSSTVSNWGFVDSNDVINLINQSGFLDSLTIQSMIDSMIAQSSSTSASGSGADFLYPDGKNNITPFFLSNQMNISFPYDFFTGTTTVINDTSYSPPPGKKLYIQEVTIKNNGNTPDILQINGITMIRGGAQFVKFSQPIILSENDNLVLKPSGIGNGLVISRYYPSSIKGFLVDANVDVEAVTFQPTNQGYQVPPNKMLVVTNLYSNFTTVNNQLGLRNANNEVVAYSNGYLDFWISGSMTEPFPDYRTKYLEKPLFFSSGEVIKSYYDIINGYLVDEDFFNSSSSSSGSGSNSTIDSISISNMGFVDSMTVVNMINSVGGSATFGEFQDITDSVLNFGNVLMNDTLRAPSDGFYVVKAQENGTGTVSLKIDSLQDLSSNSINGSQIIYRSSWSQGTGLISTITCPIKKDWYWWTAIAGGNIQKIYWVPIINNSSSNSTIDSTTISNMGFVDSMTVVNMINNSGGSGGMSFIDPVYLFYYSTTAYGGQPPNSEIVYNAGNPNNPTGYKVSIYNSITNINPITNNQSPNGVDSLIINFDSILGVHYDEIILYYNLGGQSGGGGNFTFTSTYESDNIKYPFLQNYHTASSSVFMTNQNSGNIIIKNSESGIVKIYYKIGGVSNPFLNLIVVGHFSSNTSSNSGSGSNSTIDSTTVANWGFSTDTDTQIDSTGIANLGYVAGPHTIDTDTDTQLDSAGIAAMGYLDSVTVQNMIDSAFTRSNYSSGPSSGKSLIFPEGLDNITPLNINSFFVGRSTYSVPAGKTLYILGINSTDHNDSLLINNLPIFSANTFFTNTTSYNRYFGMIENPIIVSENDVVSYEGSVNGFLVSNSSDVQPITVDLTNISGSGVQYTVPTGKLFVLLNIHNPYEEILVNGDLVAGDDHNASGNDPIKTLKNPLLFSDGDVISQNSQWSSVKVTLNGYLVDEDYFNSSGSSSGSGSNSTIDSTTVANWGFSTDTDTQIDSTGIANLGYVAGPHTIDTDTDTQIDSAGIANYGFIDSVIVMNMINQYSSSSSSGSGTGGGSCFIFPEGYNGTPITHFFGNGSYTVPTGKSLYVTIRYSASGDLKINNTTVSSGTNNYGGGSLGLLLPLILNSGDILSSTSSNSSFHGFLVEENLSSITHPFGSGNYTVPSDKTLYILNRYSNNGDLKINGTTVLAQTNNAGGGSAGLLLPVIVSAGDVVSSTNSSTSFNGYLADTSYFESSGSNVDSAAISDMGFVDSSAVQNMIDLNENSFEISKIFPDSGYCSNTSNNSPCVNYSDALIYCDTLSENGNDDWFLPSLYELSNSTSGGSVIPDYRTTDYMWSTTPVGGGYANYVQALKLLGSGNSVMMVQSWITTRIGVRCIRKKKLNTTNSNSGSGSNANTLIYTTSGF